MPYYLPGPGQKGRQCGCQGLEGDPSKLAVPRWWGSLEISSSALEVLFGGAFWRSKNRLQNVVKNEAPKRPQFRGAGERYCTVGKKSSIFLTKEALASALVRSLSAGINSELAGQVAYGRSNRFFDVEIRHCRGLFVALLARTAP